mmetsp:Transcript_44309/g.120727  ORF Transcript_44309/g.120727 Transcript_44309/m.120727 type:complete len:152 (-) Transcript_44309:55-510(-)
MYHWHIEGHRTYVPLMLTHKPLSGLLVLTPHEKGGFQMRFVLPAMPALAILAAEAATTTTITLLATSATVAKPASRPTAALAVAGLAVGVTHCLYYGVLFAPLFAELGGSGLKPIDFWEMATAVRHSPTYYPLPEQVQRLFPLLGHYGVRL